MGTGIETLTSETVELLQQLIRNRCVNDLTPEGGREIESARLLRDELDGLGVDSQLFGSVDIQSPPPELAPDAQACSSTETPMWDALTDAIQIAYPDARVVPSLVTGGTDARFFRGRGIPAYGAGLLSNQLPLEQFLNRLHGNNERIDIDSLQLTTQLWLNGLGRLWR